ncbi:MAG: pyridoxamine 5-phosphate oxidase, partial [Chloroflexota bacterium]|nr:pyridoxamine 5-phosphate oxidase [Chloroflexota bacterium]
MASWRDVETSAPEFAEKVQELFDAYRHKTLATLRKDGS